ncbi:MAG: hypothetical protein PHI73_03340 [Patescibacteria group bacterium]|nr:hypothetical protein [Patescibacteria group bacterium]
MMAKGKNKEAKRVEKGEDSAHGLMKAIFRDEKGQTLDMTRMERKTRNWRKIALVSLIVFLILAVGAAIAGFFLFNRTKPFEESGVDFSYLGGTQAVSGEEFTLNINIKNRESSALSDLIIEVQYPEGFTYAKANYGPANQYNNQWRLNNVLSNADDTLEITGQMIGEVGSSKKFSATLSYTPLNFHSEFQKSIDWEVVISESTLNLELKGPREAIPNQPVDYEISYDNVSKRDLEQIKLTVTWPSGFKLNSADPEPSHESDEWLIDRLPAGESGSIKINGQFESEPGASQEIVCSLGLAQSDGSVKKQLEENFMILMIEPQLQVTANLNEETDTQAVKWGDTLAYAINVNNAGDVKLDEGKIIATFELYSNNEKVAVNALDWENLINPQNATREGQILTWDAKGVEALKELKPGDKAEITLEIELLEAPPAELVGKENFEIRPSIEYRGQRVNSGGTEPVPFSATSQAVAARILSQPTLTVEARYYDRSGKAIGVGPLPPVEGEATVFKIFWTLKNSSNELTKASIKTTLPETVSWIGQGVVSAGEPLAFDQATRAIEWKINKVPARVGESIAALTAEFSVSLVPTREQLNDYVLLIDITVLSATDSFVNDIIEATVDAKSTSLSDDETGRGKGKVIGRGD